MKNLKHQISALIDNEIVDPNFLDELISDKTQQKTYSRYNLIGNVMRNDSTSQILPLDFSDNLMNAINEDAQVPANAINITTTNKKTQSVKASSFNDNVINFFKRFGQYAIAASVTGVVLLTSSFTTQMTASNTITETPVFNTVPLSGTVAPVSLQTNSNQLKRSIEARSDRIEALLNDHNLQLQIQP